ncbi:MAG: serine/threonine-protein kinase [Polyangiales bacterium]
MGLARQVEGTIVGGTYRVRRLLAEGGMSDILDANHLESGARVAIKVLPQSKITHSEYLARLERERRILQAAKGPGVVEVLDWGTCEAYGSYIVTECLNGRSLDGILVSRGRLSVADALPIFLEVSQTMTRLHAQNIVHRDLKPGNVFITTPRHGAQRVVLLDFGVSKIYKEPSDSIDEAEFDPGLIPVAPVTTRGELLGTVEYMSSEQLLAQHDEIGLESDIFNLGVAMFEILSGELPYGTGWAERAEHLHRRSVPSGVDQRVEGVPIELAQLVSRMIAHSRGDRPASMRNVHAELLAIAKRLPDERPPPLLEGLSGSRRDHETKRRHDRAAYVAPVRLISGSRIVDGRIEDVSEGGMLLTARLRLTPGELIAVRFALPMDGRLTHVGATVRWCREGRGRVAIGLKWNDPPEEFVAALRAYIDLMLDPDRASESITLLKV